MYVSTLLIVFFKFFATLPNQQLLPALPPNTDIPPSDVLPTSVTIDDTAAIAYGKSNSVAVEISIGLKSLTPNQLAWVLNNVATHGLSDAHLKAAIKAAKQALNTRHHSEYFQHEDSLRAKTVASVV